MIKNKKILFFFLLTILYLGLVSLIWPNIKIPLENGNNSIGLLSINSINPLNNTIRFVIFIFPPLLTYLFYFKLINKNTHTFSSFFYFNNDKKQETFLQFKEIYIIFFLILSLISIEFLNLDFPNKSYLDSLHDGDYLAAIKNHLYYGGYWSTSFTVHGGENIIVPKVAHSLFGISITNFKYTLFLFTFLLKILSIFLAFQISQISSMKKNFKILSFIFLSYFFLSFSSYTENKYINIRDLFVLVFFILLIEIYLKKPKIIFLFFLNFSAVLGFIFHYDTGTYLHVIIFLVGINFILAKKINLFFVLFLSLFSSWLIVFWYFGSVEMIAMIEQFLQLAKNIDIMHGLEFPQPFVSIGDGSNGTRATKSLILILIIGLVTISVSFSTNNYLTKNEKILFMLTYIYTVISFKNALGRSDGPHIMVSSDWINILLVVILIHFIFVNYFEKKNFKDLEIKNFCYLILICMVFFNFNYDIFLNYKNNYYLNKNNNDATFITDERKKIIKKFNEIIKNEHCVQNFTGDLSLPYILGKPNCTLFISPWLASGKKFELKFIEELKSKKVKFVIYNSPIFEVDKIKTSQRLKYVNTFLNENYINVMKFNEYELLKIKR